MSHKKNNILVVDDIIDVRDELSHILQDEGYIVTTASNGIEALQVLEAQQIDLVITDILMPEMDGIELVDKAKKLYLPDLQYILISGGGRKLAGDYDYLEVTKKLTGVSTLLKKPFKPDELIEMVTSLLSE